MRAHHEQSVPRMHSDKYYITVDHWDVFSVLLEYYELHQNDQSECLLHLDKNRSNQRIVSTFPKVFILSILSQTSPGFYMSAVQVFRKHHGKRRNCS